MSLTVKEIAELVQGTVQGDGDVSIKAARPLGAAQAGDITFVVDGRHAACLHLSKAAAALAPASVAANGLPLIHVKDPLDAFIVVVRHLRGNVVDIARGVDSKASIHPTAQIGEGASIWPFAAVGEGTVIGKRCAIHTGAVVGRNCRLGDDVTLYPNAVVYDDCVLGHRVMAHANSVIGADGFGFRCQGGKHVKIPQLGNVEIGDDVEIGACTTIDRATFETTRIGEGTKIDNLVQVAHNCQIGKHNLLIAQMGIAGSSSTGDFVVIAGQVGITDHIHIGTGAVIGARSAVAKEVAPGQRMLGAPATPEHDQKRIMMSLLKLPNMNKEIRRIKQHLGLSDEAA